MIACGGCRCGITTGPPSSVRLSHFISFRSETANYFRTYALKLLILGMISDGHLADVSNVGNHEGNGGACIAAAFLKVGTSVSAEIVDYSDLHLVYLLPVHLQQDRSWSYSSRFQL